MNSIYGFFNSSIQNGHSSNGMLDNMRDRLGYSSVECLNSTVNSGCAVGCHATSGDLLPEENLHVAITGKLYWSESTLQRIASEKGHAFAAANAYRRMGKDFLQQMHGSFAVAILEPKKGIVLLAIDRMGTRPLTFFASQDRLIFSSRADAIFAHSVASEAS